MNQTIMNPNIKSENLAKAKGYKTLISAQEIDKKVKEDKKRLEKKSYNIQEPIELNYDKPYDIIKYIIELIEYKDYGTLQEVVEKNRELKNNILKIKELINGKENIKQNKNL